eukprot:5488703-Amphidinium_carterae.1
MEWYGERCITFRNEHLERLWAMMANLHGLLRRGEHAMVSITSLPEIRSMAARQVGAGLGHPAEYAAAISWLKDQQAIETALKKGAENQGGGG